MSANINSKIKKKFLFSFGTRPEAIKLAPLIALAKTKDWIEVVVAVTAQHRQLLDQILEIFEIKPEYDLNLMGPSQGLNQLVSRAIEGLDKVYTQERPDWVFVHGDTTTSLASSLSAFHQNIPVVHIEAGLRTYNLASPFPEEMNRQLVGRLAQIHIAPSDRALRNLLDEGVDKSRILMTGNTVIDALQMIVKKIECSPSLSSALRKKFGYLSVTKKLILVTTHRRESFGMGLKEICDSIATVLRQRNDIEFVIPVHPNPNVKDVIDLHLSRQEGVHLIDPQDYVSFIFLMSKCHFILTDSGGIQEEAPALGKPVLVMREFTERQESIDAGCAKIVGTSKDSIIKAINELMDNPLDYQSMSQAQNPYGNGTASEQILRLFENL